ncbi:MAG: HPP family protein [Haloferacaceae archaeon]
MSSLLSRLRAAVVDIYPGAFQTVSEFRRWLENTRNFVHLSLFVVLPLLVALVTYLSNAVDTLPFLLFPPLASGAHTLFTRPESRDSSPRRFVGGMTTGAVCGWVALEVAARYWYHVPPQTFHGHPGAAAFGVLLTGVVTWLLDLEESQSYSTALLVLVAGVARPVYVLSVFVSSTIVAGVFLLWRREVYEHRASYLYQTSRGDDRVLVPMRGEAAENAASFGAQLARPHEACTVVLLEVVNTAGDDAGETVVGTDGVTDTCREAPAAVPADAPQPAREAAERLESRAAEITDRFDVPCEVVVAAGDHDDPRVVVETAREKNCDVVVTPYETSNGRLSRFVRGLFASAVDVVVVRTEDDRTEWGRTLVPVKRHGADAHAMLEFADRLAGETGHAAVCHCIDSESERRDAEEMVADLAETFERAFETRVTTARLEAFLSANAENYDLTIVGSSAERTVVSRVVDPPTFRQLDDLDCDLAVVNRGSQSA